MVLSASAFTVGMTMSLALFMSIGPQNAHVIRSGLRRQHLWLTVLTCIVADMVLIATGVLGLAQLGGLSDKLHGAILGAGILFLAVYGWQAFQRFRSPVTGALPVADGAAAAQPTTARQAIGTALAFSWLNPHAWLDTSVLIGTASLAYGDGSTLFGLGAATASVVWFTLLGGTAFWLGQRLNSLKVWRALDGVVALMMWGTAAALFASLF
ncbi:LysE/ArgO family amino acid transporter [Tepidicella xavieri]|jgi:L-lysine exporter family protein LysE/ArgO|uniref:L-lysine exporter family protein LysE/ArgO n=1 Tax=Tepidicella xavieri TaxID=360241 RepID=A0A4R6UET6_9BURK|nr:LysE family transporter [Tepidicella xavieri]TDQ45228.1 L-lysine exporter family protein LysE/ArgO [Tepidicella xavieri]